MQPLKFPIPKNVKGFAIISKNFFKNFYQKFFFLKAFQAPLNLILNSRAFQGLQGVA